MIFRWFFGDWVVKLLKFTKHNYNRLNIGDLPRRVWHLWQQKDKNSCDARVRVRARKGNYRYFHTSDSRYPFVPSSMRFFHSQTSIENDTPVVKKRHVVLKKWHVVFEETTRRFWRNNTPGKMEIKNNTSVWPFVQHPDFMVVGFPRAQPSRKYRCALHQSHKHLIFWKIQNDFQGGQGR